jgi:hypothetical protein
MALVAFIGKRIVSHQHESFIARFRSDTGNKKPAATNMTTIFFTTRLLILTVGKNSPSGPSLLKMIFQVIIIHLNLQH